MDWQELQRNRIDNVRKWRARYFHKAQEASPVLGYMVLWAVFNALYNVAYLPERKVQSIRERDGHPIPRMKYQRESKLLKDFSGCLSEEVGLINDLLAPHLRKALEAFSSRRPDICQPANRVTVAGQEYDLCAPIGIASIDRRVYREDGSVIYQYAPFDLELTEDGKLCDRRKFFRQLVFFLYQLRNNIVHGGAAFISVEKEIAGQALPVLQAIVDYVLKHEEVIYKASRYDAG